MLKLNAAYSKKVPAEGEYTSQSYHASIEVELPDGLSQEQLHDKIHATFAMVRESVEAELTGKSPANTRIPSRRKAKISLRRATGQRPPIRAPRPRRSRSIICCRWQAAVASVRRRSRRRTVWRPWPI